MSAKNGSNMLELGCGSGLVLMLAAHLNQDAHFTGLERSQDMLELARANTVSHPQIEIVEGSIRTVPKDWHLKFDQLIANPPYFDNRKAVRMSQAKEPSFVNTTSLTIKDWIDAMLICLKPRGYGTLIYRADGFEKVLSALTDKAGRVRILPIHSYADEPAKRVLIQFRKGVKSGSALLPPLILHERGSAEKYSQMATRILNGEKAIDMA
jgi:tRNA1(Val) A37 N6-methylase TrmN6